MHISDWDMSALSLCSCVGFVAKKSGSSYGPHFPKSSYVILKVLSLIRCTLWYLTKDYTFSLTFNLRIQVFKVSYIVLILISSHYFEALFVI